MRHVIRVAATLIGLAVMSAAGLASAPPAAANIPVGAGTTIDSGNLQRSMCTVGFPDPLNEHIVYTASHCYNGHREVRYGAQRVGIFRPDLVYSEKLDLVAIQLYRGVPSLSSLCIPGSCHSITGPRMPQVGDEVCKYGATTGETCGQITAVWDREFAMNVWCEHGDSGGPVYAYDSDGSVRLVGMATSIKKGQPWISYGTSIKSISELLRDTWGPDWTMVATGRR